MLLSLAKSFMWRLMTLSQKQKKSCLLSMIVIWWDYLLNKERLLIAKSKQNNGKIS